MSGFQIISTILGIIIKTNWPRGLQRYPLFLFTDQREFYNQNLRGMRKLVFFYFSAMLTSTCLSCTAMHDFKKRTTKRYSCGTEFSNKITQIMEGERVKSDFWEHLCKTMPAASIACLRLVVIAINNLAIVSWSASILFNLKMQVWGLWSFWELPSMKSDLDHPWH